ACGMTAELLALGGKLVPGFALVADELDLYDTVATADRIITGEEFLDEQSFHGKVVGGVQAMAGTTPVAAIVGDSAPEVADRVEHVSLGAAVGRGAGLAR